jgi:hypothetical protein
MLHSFARDLDAAYLDRYLRSAVPDAAYRAAASWVRRQRD